MPPNPDDPHESTPGSRSRLLVLTQHPESCAATRFRACEYFPFLREAEIDPVLDSFTDEAFYRRAYVPGEMVSKGLSYATFLFRRLGTLARARDCDAVFVQRQATPVGPPWLEMGLVSGLKLPMLFDFDDAIWLDTHRSSRHPRLARMLKSPRKSNQLIKTASRVIAGSAYLAQHAEALGAHTTVLPTVVSRERWKPFPWRLDGELSAVDAIPTLGWIGTHSTAPQLELLVPALRELARRGHRFRVRLVGAERTIDIPGIPVESVAWHLDREIEDFQRIDIGLAPMFDDEWAKGKCAFKQVQYMSVGVPMVSSRSGAAAELLVPEKNALIAEHPGDWLRQLERLLTDRDLRRALARAGRELVETSLSIEAQAPTFVNVIRSVLRRPAM